MEGVRNKRGNVSERVDVAADKLSELPDSVLSHVLSLLPTTKEAVKTSILSKRWKNLWTYVHTLVFWAPGSQPPEKMQFSQFVNRVLRCHRGSIKKMILGSVNTSVNDFDIRNWISYAIDRGVEILELDDTYVDEMKFRWPFCLFRSQTLVDLRLYNVDITNLNIPSAPFFPSLKKLKVRILELDFKSVESLKLLISGCSLLEDLSMDGYVVPRISLNVSSSTLKRLLIDYTYEVDESEVLFHPTFVLEVPALEFLHVTGPPAGLFVKGQLRSLTDVIIDIPHKEDDEDGDVCYDSVVRLLEHISNVKVLRLVCNFEKPLTFTKNAKFPNLTELKISSSCFEWPLLGSFMESSMNLESITLIKRHSDLENHVYWIDPQNVPYCLLSSLRRIYIEGCRIENALDMVDYVLRNAELLEMMDISGLKLIGDYKTQCEILLKLVMIKRASRRCQLSVV